MTCFRSTGRVTHSQADGGRPCFLGTVLASDHSFRKFRFLCFPVALSLIIAHCHILPKIFWLVVTKNSPPSPPPQKKTTKTKKKQQKPKKKTKQKNKQSKTKTKTKTKTTNKQQKKTNKKKTTKKQNKKKQKTTTNKQNNLHKKLHRNKQNKTPPSPKKTKNLCCKCNISYIILTFGRVRTIQYFCCGLNYKCILSMILCLLSLRIKSNRSL